MTFARAIQDSTRSLLSLRTVLSFRVIFSSVPTVLIQRYDGNFYRKRNRDTQDTSHGEASSPSEMLSKLSAILSLTIKYSALRPAR